MLTTLTGSNDFARHERLQALVKAFIAEHGDFAIEKLDGDEASAAQMRASVESLPFLTPRKLVILQEPSKQKAFTEAIDIIIEVTTETTDIIIVEPKLDKRLSYYKTLKKKTTFEEFPELDAAGLASWAVGYVKEQGGSLARPDAGELINRVGTNQAALQQELNKLLSFNPQISRESIAELTEKAPQSTVFELLDAAFAGNHQKAIALYADQRAQKVEPQAIVAMLAWQLQIMALVKTAGARTPDEIAKSAKLNPFVVRKTAQLTKRISLEELKQQISRLYTIDLNSKRKTYDLDEALNLFLLQL